MALSERQMILLDCFMYSDIAQGQEPVSVEELISSYTDSSGNVSLEKINKAVAENRLHLSGDLDGHPENLQDVMQKMLNDDTVRNLQVTRTSEERYGKIRAACFMEKDSGEVTVAFRGTGGSLRQWSNNFEGYGDVDQETQRDAEAFLDSLPYDQVDVTGHSNGGNQAMYLAVVRGDKVRRCVSYEGQGFSKEFYETYADKIEANRDKIKNICGQVDFVGIIMISVAGETKYVPNGDGVHHGTYEILIRADKADGFDENGNFKEDYFVEQAGLYSKLHDLTVFMATVSDIPIIGSFVECLADELGIIIGIIIDRDTLFTLNEHTLEAWATVIERIIETFTGYVTNLVGDLYETVMIVLDYLDQAYKKIKKFLGIGKDYGAAYSAQYPEVRLDTGQMRNYAERIIAVTRRISTVDKRMDSLYLHVKSVIDLLTLTDADILTGYSWKLNKCADYLNETAAIYESTENEIATKLG